MSDLVGTTLGHYVIQRALGAGGMGTVYLAEHPQLHRKVAVKVLHDENAADPETVARFFQEARAAAEIGQENIIDVLDAGTVITGGRQVVYLIMEMLDGESLGTRMRRGRMSDDEIRHVLLQCCAALGASHAHGIIHRDIKPENIYLVRRRRDPLFVKVLDFGIAKLIRGPGSGRTRIGTILGTPEYMSPEQCLGRGEVDARSDVYALGVLLYEMLCGQRPFGGTLGEMLQAHVLTQPVPPSRRAHDVSPDLEAIALRCLAKRKDDRYPSMEALAAALEAPPHLLPVTDAPTVRLSPDTARLYLARQVHAPTRSYVAIAVAAVLSLGVAAGSVVMRNWMDRHATPLEQRFDDL